MNPIVKIDGQAIEVADFLRNLKLSGQFDGLIEQLVRDRLTVLAAKKAGIPCRSRKSRTAPTSFAACAACTVPPTPTSTWTPCGSAWTSSRPSSPTACTRKR